MSSELSSNVIGHASSADIKQILGALDEGQILEIMALHPTIRDVEEAATWLAGDRDIFGAGEPLRGIAAEIIAVLASNEEDEEAQHSRRGL